jgi:predicted transcriptional regulator
MHNSGYSAREIAEAVGAKRPDYIRKILADANLVEVRASGKYIDKGKIIALRKAGWNISSIAFEMCMTRKEVEEILHEHDIP